MKSEKSKLKIGLEVGGLIGGIATILMLMGGAAGVFSQVIKEQAQHETRIDVLERNATLQTANDQRFQDQVTQQLNRIQDENKENSKELRAQIEKIYEFIKLNK